MCGCLFAMGNQQGRSVRVYFEADSLKLIAAKPVATKIAMVI